MPSDFEAAGIGVFFAFVVSASDCGQKSVFHLCESVAKTDSPSLFWPDFLS
jgi:hypothetical protein